MEKQLSMHGKMLSWQRWLRTGGCNLSPEIKDKIAGAYGHKWEEMNITLDNILDACPEIEEIFVKHIVDVLGRNDLLVSAGQQSDG